MCVVLPSEPPEDNPAAARAMLRQSLPALRYRERGEAIRAYTVEQIAEALQIGRDKVYQLLRTGQLNSIKIGNSRRITSHQLAEFITALETSASESEVMR